MYPSAIAWEGRSLFDGAPIAVVVSNIGNVYSKNPKCGKYMAQATILRTDMHPQDAVLTGSDYSICGDCKHRGRCTTNSRGILISTRSCYVLLKGIISVYHAVKRDSYHRMEPGAISEQIRRRAVLRGVPTALRVGSYGDPAAVPTWVWKDLAGEVKIVTGYTHQWKRCDQAMKSLMMASADTQEEAHEAQSMGWRTFRILTPDQKPTTTETLCRNVRTGTACQACGLCGGTALKAKHVAMPLHGSKRVHFYENVEVTTSKPWSLAVMHHIVDPKNWTGG
jgi:hypothetical protein